MANMSDKTPLSIMALAKRSADSSLMPPPPPPKRIERPAKVLDEDEYTKALSDIIARDYFPGLAETTAQEEYLTALESNNDAWIREAGDNLKAAMTPQPRRARTRSARNSRFSTPSATPLPAATTPKGWTGGETPMSESGQSVVSISHPELPTIDASALSLSAFQAKYTSEDNASFNSLLDTQNEKTRAKNAHFWTKDNKKPTPRLIAHRAREQQLLAANTTNNDSERALVPLTTGATSLRSARTDSWTTSRPNNTFMFNASSIDEDAAHLETTAQKAERESKAGPRAVVHANTRFTPARLQEATDPVPASPTLSAVVKSKAAAAGAAARSETEYSGAETPTVEGYAFVDEDEPADRPADAVEGPELSYRDLLAGQAGDGTSNPFKLREMLGREKLHHRLVERDLQRKRGKEKAVEQSRNAGSDTPRSSANSLTPAAQRLLGRMGATPLRSMKQSEVKQEEDWTPKLTPRRKVKT